MAGARDAVDPGSADAVLPDAVLPDPALVVLVGPAGSGKSTWAARRYLPAEIVSSDGLRAMLGSGEADLDASDDALAMLERIAAARLGRRLTTVIDTLGMDAARRARLRAMGASAGMPAIAVVLDADPQLCRARNAARDRPVPAPALRAQIARMPAVRAQLDGEGWDWVVVVDGSDPAGAPATGPATATSSRAPRPAMPATTVPAPTGREPGAEPGLRLQISRFPWGEDPSTWLREVASAAAQAGFEGIALMDHLIQIPQVGRDWEPIPDPWVTLGMLAGAEPDLLLGTLVSPVTFRPAGVLAKAAATLDALSGGRAFLGLGAGWWAREHAAYGLAFPPTARRMNAMGEAIETMRALWRAGTKPHAGPRVQLPETTLYPRPVGPLPIIVGGGGERRTLAIAAELADGCNVSSADDVAAKIAVLHEHCRLYGRNPAEVAVTVLDVPIIGSDRADVARRVERRRGRVSASAFAARHHAGEARDHIARYRSLGELGVSTVFLALPDLAGAEDLERVAPIVAALRRG